MAGNEGAIWYLIAAQSNNDDDSASSGIISSNSFMTLSLYLTPLYHAFEAEFCIILTILIREDLMQMRIRH